MMRQQVRPYDPARDPAPRSMGAGLPALVTAVLTDSVAAPGDSLVLHLGWRAARSLPAGAYRVAVRFDRALPPGFSPPAWLAKPARKLLERRAGVRYRFREDHLPGDGDFGVDLWRPEQVVLDSVQIHVPADVAPGDYEVQVRMLRQPHYPNYRLQDYFLDHDYYTGLPVGTLHVTARAPGH